MKSATEGLHHCGATRDNDRTLQTLAQVQITSFDTIRDEFVNARVLKSYKRWSEQDLRCSTLIRIANVDLRTIWQDEVICIVLSSSVILTVHSTVLSTLSLT